MVDSPAVVAPQSVTTGPASSKPSVAASQRPLEGTPDVPKTSKEAGNESAPRVPRPEGGDPAPEIKESRLFPLIPEPRSAFTVVRKDETLRDVAVRVYGSADQLDSLWRANRDLLPRADSPLPAGSVLRTPEE